MFIAFACGLSPHQFSFDQSIDTASGKKYFACGLTPPRFPTIKGDPHVDKVNS